MASLVRGNYPTWKVFWLVACILGLGFSSCPFQTPFGFHDSPQLKPVLDEFGNTNPEKVWIDFGRIINRKCVDYFRVTYSKSDKSGVTQITSDRIDRNAYGTEVAVVPCTLYTFRVVGYEEFHGMGRQFKMESNEVNFTLDYTPQFLKKPIVMEKVASPNSRARNIRAIHPYTTTTPATTTEPFLVITIIWDLSYIDFPICLDRVEFQYLNIEWDESSFTKTFDNPKKRMFFVVNNKKLPCDEEFSFTAKAFGVNGLYTNTTWDPPSCISTTPPPTTEGSTPPEFVRCHSGASFVFLYLFCT